MLGRFTCSYCGNEFGPMRKLPVGKRTVFCSTDCQNRHFGIEKKPFQQFEKVCKNCGKSFVAHRSNRVFCSTPCASKYQSRNYTSGISNLGLTRGKIGAVAELMVCSELMKLGFEVFRAVSASSHSDLVIVKSDKVFKIEVKSGRYGANGKLYWPAQNIEGKHVIVFTHSDNKLHFVTDPTITI